MAPLSFLRDRTVSSDTTTNSGPPTSPLSANYASTSTSAAGTGSRNEGPTSNSTVEGSGLSSPKSFRFLRRKVSLSAKSSSARAAKEKEAQAQSQSSDVDTTLPAMPNTASTMSSFSEAMDSPPPGITYNARRRGSEPILEPTMQSPRGWQGDRKKSQGSDGVIVIDAGVGTGEPSRGLSKTAAEHPFMAHLNLANSSDGASSTSTTVQIGSSDLTPGPVYSTTSRTPLSPSRRPMPRSRPMISDSSIEPPPFKLQSPRSPRPPLSTSTSSISTTTPPGSYRLARRPSTAQSTSLDSPYRPAALAGAAPITPTSSSRSRNISNSSSLDADHSTSAESEDGEVGVVATKRKSHQRHGDNGQYEVEVVCLDTRTENDEMKWEVVIRKKRSTPTGETANPSNGSTPLQVSTGSSVAPAPTTASSLNLSLSLDQPTGKLVFIAFPMDIHATPRRRAAAAGNGTAAHSTPTTASSSATTTAETTSVFTAPPSVSTATTAGAVEPPPWTPSSAIPATTPTKTPSTPPRLHTPPPAPNLNASPSTPPPIPGHRKRVSESSMYPSPSRASHRSPSVSSPRAHVTGVEMWTPRRTRMVSASELNGGLYAQGTVDGMSEELEQITMTTRRSLDRPEDRAARVARWNHDRI